MNSSVTPVAESPSADTIQDITRHKIVSVEHTALSLDLVTTYSVT